MTMNDETANNQSNERSSSAETIEIFKPSLIDEKAVPLSRDDISYADKIESDKDGLVKVKLEDEVIMQRVSKDLYKSPESGFRELFNNEARACRYAKAKHGAKPEIKVILDPMERSLVIQGFDSMGMSMEMFNRVFTWAGRSTNFDSGEIGQFGLGRFAYVQLSDTMLLETYSRETGEKYAVLGKSGTVFQKMPRPDDLESYGTRITMVIRDDVSLGKLSRYIALCGRFTGIDAYLHVTNNFTDDKRSHTKERTYNFKGVYKIGSFSYKEYLEMEIAEYKRRDTANSEIRIASKIPVILESEYMDVHGYFVLLEKESSFSKYDKSGELRETKRKYYELLQNRGGHEFLLLGTPIKMEGDEDHWRNRTEKYELPIDFAIVNIKDERRFPPTADREGFSDKARENIKEALKEIFREKLDFINVPSIKAWQNSEYKDIIPHLRDSFRPYLNRNTLQTIDVLNIHVECINYRDPDNFFGHYKIAQLLDRGISIEKLVISNNNKQNTIARLRTVLPDKIYITLPYGQELERDTALLLNRGAMLASDLYDKYKHLFKRSTKIGEVTAYSAIPRDEEHKHQFGKINKLTFTIEKGRFFTGEFECENVIKIPYGKIPDFTNVFKGLATGYLLVKDDGQIPYIQDMKTFVDKYLGKVLQSSDGEIRVGDLMPYNFTKPAGYGLIQKKLILVDCFDKRVLKYLRSDKDIYVAVDDDDTRFAIGACCRMYNRAFTAGYTFYDLRPEAVKFHVVEGLKRRLHLSDSQMNLLIFQITKELPEKNLWMTFIDSLDNQVYGKKDLMNVINYVVEDLGPRFRGVIKNDTPLHPNELGETPSGRLGDNDNDDKIDEFNNQPKKKDDVDNSTQQYNGGGFDLGEENYDANYNFRPGRDEQLFPRRNEEL